MRNISMAKESIAILAFLVCYTLNSNAKSLTDSDDCSDAISLDIGISTGILECGDNGTLQGSTSACVDPEAQGCMVGVGGIWYTFSSSISTSSFWLSVNMNFLKEVIVAA